MQLEDQHLPVLIRDLEDIGLLAHAYVEWSGSRDGQLRASSQESSSKKANPPIWRPTDDITPRFTSVLMARKSYPMYVRRYPS